jgi:outer membrane immunogenic protein
MRNVLIAALAATIGVSTSAHAADLGEGSYKDEPVFYAPATPVWAGLYVGGSAGFGVGDTTGQIEFDGKDGRDDKLPRAVAPDQDLKRSGGYGLDDYLKALLSSAYDVDGAIYGAHIGYNWQRSNLVYGVELGLNGSDIDGADRCFSSLLVVADCERSLDWYATAVARLGYASGNTLFYGFGGVAWGEVSTNVKVSTIFGGLNLSGEETHVGWTAGLGIEHAFTDRFSARVEYSHVELGSEDHSLGEHGYLKSDVDLSFDAIKVGASYKLTGARESLDSYK